MTGFRWRTRTISGLKLNVPGRQGAELSATLLAHRAQRRARRIPIYTDHGLTGTSRARPGLDQARAAARQEDTLVVAKLDRLARSVPDAGAIADQLSAKGMKPALGQTVCDPGDPMGKMFFNVLATFAEFEADLIRMRTREGMAVARARGKLRGKQPKLSAKQARELRRMYDTGEYSVTDLAEVFAVSRATVYRTLERVRP